MEFKELKLSSKMLETLSLIRYEKATPIQEKAIPFALKGHDIIGQAHTGTGKTASFGIPIIENVDLEKGLQHVILAPSRELATQIYNELNKLATNRGIKIIDIIGGISYNIQKKNLSQNPHIIVATPGRFIDNHEKNLIKFNEVKTFTLDEADEMLNFGFLKEIKKIRSQLPDKIQTFFFTATFNKKIKLLAEEMLVKPISISISSGLNTSDNIQQKFMIIKEQTKVKALVSLLELLKPQATIVFARTKKRVDDLTQILKELGFLVTSIQGDMRQNDRSRSIANFKIGKIKIIIATDVIARGIDFHNVDYVFNFDLPENLEYYTHRVGRTGRSENKGIAISLIKHSELNYFKQILKKTHSSSSEIFMPSQKEIFQVQEKELKKTLEKIVLLNKAKLVEEAQKITKFFTHEELAIIVASKFIKSKNIDDAKLSDNFDGNFKKNSYKKNSYKKSNFKSKSPFHKNTRNNTRNRKYTKKYN